MSANTIYVTELHHSPPWSGPLTYYFTKQIHALENEISREVTPSGLSLVFTSLCSY